MLPEVYGFPSDLQAKLAEDNNCVENEEVMRATIFVTAILLSVCVWARGEGKEAAMPQFTLTSPSFRNSQPIPAKHSCEGGDVSPELKWEGAPAGTKSFALICDDPDAPGGTWVHWLIYNTPGDTTELPLGIRMKDDVVVAAWSPSQETGRMAGPCRLRTAVGKLPGAKQGVNDFGKVGYGGPCPPRGHGVHHYHFRSVCIGYGTKAGAARDASAT